MSRFHRKPADFATVPDSRDAAPICPYPMAQLREEPAFDRSAVEALLEELIEDDNIRESTHGFLSSLHEQLEERGSLSAIQVQRIYEVRDRRDRADGRSF